MHTTMKRLTALVAALALMGGLAACGSDKPAAKASEKPAVQASAVPTATYVSTQNVQFMSSFPQYTYKQATFQDQILETYKDGTYRLTSVDSMFSGSLTFPDEGKYEAVPRGSVTTTLYGKAKVADSDGLATIDLDAPTRAISVSSFSAGGDPAGYLDTSAWTDSMGSAAAKAARKDGSISAKDYLASVSFGKIQVVADSDAHTFDFIKSASESK